MENIIKDNEKANKKYNSKDMKIDLLEAMTMTQSWLTLEELQTALSPEQYQELLTIVKSNLEQYYAKLNIPDVTQEEIDKEIAEEIERKVFEIGVDDKGGFILQESLISRDRLTRPINPNQLDEIKLARAVENAMQKHLDYGTFHANKYLTKGQMPRFLDYYIKLAREYQVRAREEAEIGMLSSERKELLSEIKNLDRETAELRGNNEELRGENER